MGAKQWQNRIEYLQSDNEEQEEVSKPDFVCSYQVPLWRINHLYYTHADKPTVHVQYQHTTACTNEDTKHISTS